MGHTIKKSAGNIIKMALEWNPQGCKRREGERLEKFDNPRFIEAKCFQEG